MPIVISGYLTVSTKTLTEHSGHALEVRERPVRLWCQGCDAMVAEYIEPEPTLYCGCRTQEEHDDGQRIQERERKRGGIPKEACVGCWLGDDGPTIHSCMLHG